MTNSNLKVSIVSLFRDEADYLKEWIEFHLMIGVDQFHLVNNNSIDNFEEVLDEYLKNNIVIIHNIEIETIHNTSARENEVILVSHWISKLNEIVKKSSDDWMIHVSTDEFLYPTNVNNIKDVLIEYPKNVGEVSVNWTMFGNGGITLKSNELMIEHLIKSSFENHPSNYHVKPIFRPIAVNNISSVHYTNLKRDFIKVDATGKTDNFKTPYEVKERVNNPLKINHYRLRDLKWTHKKIKIYELWNRPNPNELIDLYNDIENRDIHRFLDQLKARLFDK